MRGLLVVVVALAACDGEVRFTADPSADASVAGDAPAEADAARCSTPCPFASQRCDPVTGACVECVVDAHCVGDHRARCDVASHRCVECGLSADCEDDEVCDPIARSCMQRCGGDAEACGSEAPRCDATRSLCVCDSTSCSADRPRCDSTGRCVECAADGDCAATEPRCHEGACVRCAIDQDCAPLRCDPVRRVCVE